MPTAKSETTKRTDFIVYCFRFVVNEQSEPSFIALVWRNTWENKGYIVRKSMKKLNFRGEN